MTTTAHLTDERAQLLLERLLPAGEAAAAEAHAAGCPACRALLGAHRALAEALSGMGAPEIPAGMAADFTARVLARIEQGELAARERRLGAAILAAAAAAAAAALASAGPGDWAGVVSDLLRALGGGAAALRIAGEALAPVTSALRAQILIGCAAVGLPILLALARLSPAREARPA